VRPGSERSICTGIR